MAKKPLPRQRPPPRMLIEEIEARILHSADAMALLDPGLAGGMAQVRMLEAPASPAPAPAPDPMATRQAAQEQAQRHEIVFIDPRLPDARALAADIVLQGDAGRHIEIIDLDPAADGIAQIGRILADRHDISAVHLISHGADGRVALGSKVLDFDTLRDEATRIKAWGDAFTEDADLLIYGCDVAASGDGQSLINALASLTGADVAASDYATGHTLLGGDWELEIATGNIESGSAVSAEFQARWIALLPTYQQFTNFTSESEIKSDSNWGQTFTHTSGSGSYAVNQLSLALRRDSDASAQNITVTLRSGGWNGSILGSATIASSSLGTSLAFVDFAISGVTLTDGTQYTIRVTTDTTAGKVHAGVNASGGYAGGTKLDTNGSALSGEDMAFKIALGATLQATGDTTIKLKAPDAGNNFGATTQLLVDRESSDLQRALLQFDLSGIPTGATINSATLKLQSTAIDGSLTINVYEVTQTWTEGSANGAAGVASWNERQTGTAWTTAGGTIDPAAVATLTTASSGQHTWSVTALVQAWVNGSKLNNGLLIGSPDGGGNRTATYDSSEGTTVPLLSIDYTLPVNAAPTVANLAGDALTAITGGAAAVIDQGGNASVTDADSANFSGGTLTVSFAAGSDAGEDVLAIRHQGSGAGQIGVSGANVTYAGTTIGTWAGGSGGANLVVTLNANANSTNTAALLQNITYENTDAVSPTGGARTVRFVLTDGDGGTSANADATVNVPGVANTLVVTTTSDVSDGTVTSIAALIASKGADGVISLREAITAANNTPGTDFIRFNIAGAGPHKIDIASVLPSINEALIIDGISEPDYVAGTPVVRIDGAAAGFNGINIGAGGGGSTIRGLMITGFTGDGINVASGANYVTIADNWIGTAGTGTSGHGNANVGNSDDGIEIVGSNALILRNVVNNNNDEGIDIKGSGVTGHVIQGNTIGLDPDGSTSVTGNNDVGIAVYTGSGNTIGGTTAAARNVISKNNEGIEVRTSDNLVQGNYIGTDATGTVGRGNRVGSGVQVQDGSTNNQIGGAAAGAGNLIAYNDDNGVDVVDGSGHLILGNAIHSNTLLGINLGTAGVTGNDADDPDGGANNLQNFPVLTAAVADGSQVVISGSLNSEANKAYRIEFFANTANDNEGQRYLGFTNVTTPAGSPYTINFTATLTATVAGGEYITATATDPSNNTSEFSAQFAAASGLGIWANNNTTPEFAQWNGSAFGTQANSANTDRWQVIRAAEAPTRTEIIAVGEDSAGIINGQMWNGSAWTAFSFNDLVDLATTDFRSVELAYEQQSGNAMLVWDNGSTGSASLSYRTWNGSAWSAAQTITTPVAGEAVQLSLAADPNSNAMVLAVSGTPTANDYALVWNGTSWGNGVTLDTGTGADRTEVHAAYESHSGHALVTYDGDGSTNAINYRTWDGTSWSGQLSLTAPAGIGAANDANLSVMASDANSDRVALAVVTDSAEIWLSVWDGSAWTSQVAATTTAAIITSPVVGVAFEHDSGDLLAAYGKAGSNIVFYRTWTSGGGWSAETSGPNIGGVPNSVMLYADPQSNRIMLGAYDSGSDVNFAEWTGSGWNAVSGDMTGNTGTSGGFQQPLAYAWYDNNRTPVLAAAAFSTPENSTAVGTVSAIDADGDTLVYSISGGADAARFTIGAATGVLSFVAAPDFESPADAGANNVYDVIVRTSDQTGGTDSTAIAVTVTAVNEAPTATITPLTYSATEQTSLTLHGTGLAIADVDAGSSTVEATLGVVSGTLTVSAGTTGVTVSNSGTATVTLSGTITQINNLLAGNLSGTVTYILGSDTPPASDTLTLTASDLGNTGSGGTLTANDTATINLTAVNDAPTATITPPTYSATEQTSLTLHGTGLAIADVDAGSSTVQATLGVVSGTLTVGAGTTGVTVTNSGTATVTLSGTITQINNLLAGNLSGTVTYILGSDTPPASDTLTLTASDLGNTGSGGTLTANDTATINLTAVNDAPTATITPPTYSATEQTSLTLHGTGMAIADVDAGSSTVQATLGVVSGTLTVGAGTTGVTVSNSGTATVTLSGTITQINNLLAGNLSGTVTYMLGSDTPPASDTLTLTASDLGNTGSGGTLTGNDTATINLTAVNDAPTITSAATVTLGTTTEDTTSAGTLASTILAAAAWADVDSGAASGIAITSVTGNGTWQYSTDGATWNSFGSVSTTNALLLTLMSQVRYIPDSANAESATFGFNAWDQTSDTASTNTTPGYASTAVAGGSSAYSSASATASLSVTAVNDAPLFTALAVAQGAETLVNTNTTDIQTIAANARRAMASDAGGNFVVVWSSNLQDGALYGVYAQRYSATGTAQGAEFRVNTTTADSQILPTVAMDAAGNFVVNWSSNNQDGGGYGVYAQRYNAAGVAQGGEFLVNSTTANSQITSQIAMSSSGAFVIVWNSTAQDPDSSNGIYGQRFDAGGVAQGAEFRVNTYTTGTQQLSSTSMDASGNFVVTWASNAQDGSNYGVYGQVYSAAGVAQGGEFRANTATANAQLYNDVAMLADGRFVVAYQSRNADSSYEVYLQRYSAAGAPLGPETRVNTTTVSSAQQPLPAVSVDAAGNIALVWNSAADGSGVGVVGRLIDWSGTPLAAEFQVNTTTAGNQTYPHVMSQPGGGFVVAWGGNGAGDADGVFMQRYSLQISANNFTTITEDQTSNSGDLVSTLISGKVADVDAGAATGIAVTGLASGNGTWQYSTNNGGNWNDVGAVATNSALLLRSIDKLRFVPDAMNADAASVSFNVWDQDVGGFGSKIDATVRGGSSPFSSASVTSAISVSAVNDAPTATITPPTYSATEQASLTLHGTGLAIADVDAGSSTVQATLGVVSGTLTVGAGTTGVTVSNSGTATVTLSGTLAQINNLLAGSLSGTVTYILSSDTPPASDTLTLTASDLGNSGSGGTLTANDTATINLTAVNDAPTATITPPTYSATEQASLTLHGTGLAIADVDAGSSTVQATLGVVSGTLTVGAGTTGVTVSNSGTATVTLSGTITQINNLLAGNLSGTVTYILGSDSPPASDTLTLTASDLGNSGSGGTLTANDTATINLTAVNDAPTATITPPTYSATEQTSLTLHGTGLAIADVDAGSSTVQATLGVVSGTLSVGAGTTGVTVTNSGTATVTLSGTITQINNLLAGNLSGTVTYILGSDSPPASDTLTLTASDLGNTGSGGTLTANDTATINLTAVNDAPTATITPPTYSATEQTSLTLHGTGLAIADVDAGSSTVQATLGVVSGTLTVGAGTTGVTVSNSGTATVTLSGTITQINNLLAGNLSGTVTYILGSDTPPASDTLTLTASDLGNTGSGGTLTANDTATINLTAVNDAPTATITPPTYSATEQTSLTLHGTGLAIADVDAGSSTVQATLGVVSGTLTVGAGTTGVTVSNSGTATVTLSGTITQINNLLAGNLSGTVTYMLGSDTPPASDTLTLTASDLGNTGSGGTLTANDTAIINLTAVNDAPTTSLVTLAAIAENSGVRLITQAQLLANAADVDGPGLSATGLAIASGTGTLVDNGNGTWNYTPAANDDTAVSFTYTVTDGSLTAAGTANLDITPVNDAPTTSLVTLAPIAEDSGVRLITQAQLLANAADIDGPGLTATGLAIASGSGTLVDNGNGTWNYTPASNDDTAVSFTYTVTDGSLTAAGTANLDITPVNDAPTTSLVNLAAIAEDSGMRLITQAQLLANAADIDGPGLTATSLAIASGSGTLVDNGDGTWNFTPTANDDTAVSFTYTVTDGSLSAAGTANLDITPVNDAPTTSLVTLAPIAEDSGVRLITQAQLLGNATDIDGPGLTATGLAIASGSGSLVDNGDGTWNYTPASNDDTAVSFTYTVTDGSLTAAGTANLDITPVNDAPTTSLVTLAPIAEDSGVRLITQAQLLANAADIDGPGLTATSLAIASGSGTLVDNGDGTWNFTPTANDDTAVSFTYTVTDGSLSAAGTANLDITPLNDAPTTSLVTLAPIAEDSGVRLITQAQLLANAADIDGPGLSATGLAIASGSGSLVDNGDGTWNYTPASNDDTAVSFTYTVTDGSLTAAGTANLDITPVNDAPTTSTVTLAAIAEDSGVRLITQAQLLANAADIDGPGLSATGLVVASGSGSLVDNGDGTWNYTPASNDDTAVSFTYTVTDGSLGAAGTANLDITPVNDSPTTSLVTLAAIVEDSGARLITQAQLLANAADVDGPGLSATGLAIASGSGSLVDNGDGTWNYTPAANDDTAASFTYTVTDGSLTAAGTANLDITPFNDAPTTSLVTLAAIGEDSGIRLITQAQLLANAADIDGPGMTATSLAIATGSGALVDNGDGTWNYTPAANDDTAVSFTYTVTDGSLTAAGTANLDVTPVNDAPTTSTVTLTAIAENSGVRLITQAQLLANAADIDGPGLSATGLAIASGSGLLVDNGDGTWNYTPATNDDTAVSFTCTVTDGSLTAAGTANLDITPVNDAPTTSTVTLAAIAEDSGVRLITQAQLLANAADIDGPGLSATGLVVASGSGALVDNGDGTWNYTPAANDDTAVSFTYTVTDGSLTAAGTANLDITAVNDAPTTSLVTLAPIAEDSGVRLITQAQLLANAADLDGPGLTATSLAIATGSGALVDNGDGTWNYTPAANDDTAVSFTYTVTDGSLTAAGTANLDITPVNDAPTTSLVNLAPIAEDSGVRLITQAQLLANAADLDGPGLTATSLAIATGSGSLVDNGDGTWNYTPASNDDTAVSFTYTVTDGSLTAAGTANLDITPVNDVPTTSLVTLAPIAEDSGVRLITQVQLLANAADVDGPGLSATGLAIASGSGSLVDNGDGTWNYTPAANDDTAVSFTYTVTDGSLTAAGTANLDITAVNDAPTTSLVTLAAIAEDSGVRLITQAQLLANAGDIDGPGLSATGLAIATGSGTLVDNGDGTWNYIPAANDDTAASFTYTVTDGSLTAAGTANLDITPVNDAPTTSTVTLAAIAEDSGVRLITQAQLLANAADIDGPGLSATGLVVASGSGALVDNGDGTWNYTPAANDDTAASFTYTVTDGSLTAAGTANLDITPVNDLPTTSLVTLAPIAEDSGVRLITQAQLLANAADVDGPGLSATGLAIASGSGSLVDNGDGTWNYTPAANDDTTVSFTYTVTDGSLTAAGTANLDIIPVNDAPTTSLVTLAPIAEDSGVRLITQAQLLANASDIDGPSTAATGLAIATGSGTLVDNGDGTWNYTPAADDDTAVSFTYTVTDGSLAAAGTADLDVTPVNDSPTTSLVTLAPIAEDSGVRLITQAQLLANAADVDGPGLSATGLVIASGSGALVDNGDGTWNYTPASNDDTAVSFTYTVTDGSLGAAGTANLDITAVNDAPTTSLVTLAAIVEDSGARLITQAQLLANAADIDGPGMTATSLAIATGSGSLVDNGDGTWNYTPAANDDTAASFTYTVTDGSLTAAGTANLDITPVNDAPTTSLVTLAPIAEDSGVRLITQAQLLANAGDIDGPGLSATGLVIASGSGSLVDNGDGTWNYTPAANDDTAVSFTYTVTDGSLTAAGTANLDITPVNDAPTTSLVTLAAIGEDSGVRLITQAQWLANAADVDGPGLSATGLAIASGSGSLVDNGDGTWNYTPATNDDTAVSFTCTVTDGSLTAAGTANLDITPVNDAPTTSTVTLAAIAEDSGVRLITQAQLLANAADIDGPGLSATGLVVASGSGALVDNGDGTWNYTPAANDDTAVSFTYTVTDGSLTAAGTANLDITAVNDAPTTSLVTLAPIAEDSGVRLITQAQLLANAADIDGPGMTATSLAIATGSGALVDNGDGTWNYTPAANDDTAASFTYTVTDGSLTAAGTANLDITPVNDVPTTSLVTLAAIGEDSGIRLITQAQLLANAADIDGPGMTATSLAIATGSGALVDNGDGTWNYTPAANDDTAASFTYTVTDGSLTAAGTANLDMTPVNDAPTTSLVTLAPIAEDSGVRLITQAQLLANAGDIDGPGLSATGLAIATGSGTLVDNGDGTWNYTPTANDDTAVSFTYTVTDGSLTAAGTANLDITAVNDAPTTSLVTLAAIAEDSGVRLITQAQLLANAGDIDGPGLSATGLAIATGSGTLVDNGDGTWNYTPTANDDTAVSFTYTLTDGSLTAAGTANLDVTPTNDAPTLSNGAMVTLGATTENLASAPASVNTLLAGSSWADVDSGAAAGIAVTASSGSGSWQFSADGLTWTGIGAVSPTNALLLASTSQVRHVAGAGAGTATLAFSAWDQSSGTAATNGAPSYADPGIGGAVSAFSVARASAALAVTAVPVVLPPDPLPSDPPPPPPPPPIGPPPTVTPATGAPPPAASAPPSASALATAAPAAFPAAEAAAALEQAITRSVITETVAPLTLVPVRLTAGEASPTSGFVNSAAFTEAWDFASLDFRWDALLRAQNGPASTAWIPPSAALSVDFGSDTAGEKAPNAPSLFLTLENSVKFSGAAAAAGFVAWALRGAGLASGLLISMPAWRHLDPIPVLSPDEAKPDWEREADDQKRREDDEASGETAVANLLQQQSR